MLSAACRRALCSAATGKEAAAAALRHPTPAASQEEPLDINHIARLANLQPQPSYAQDAAALLAYVRVLEHAPTEPEEATTAEAPRQQQTREE